MKRWPTKLDDWYRLKPLARELRRKQTKAEIALWQAIRQRKVAGFRFQRQRVFQDYIVDFYCPEARLVLEVDGSIHDQQKDKDANRQTYLERHGFRFLRFPNDDVMNSRATVVRTILAALLKPLPKKTG